MRKKYLSALLFGALLLASAGTFTSCKDYDDDIKNLQEQINTVKTSLDELTTKVNNLGAGITDFKYENGQLVIVTDKDTNFTVDMPECEGIVKLEIKDGVLYADGVAVGNVTGDGGSVVEVKDGVIYIDGEAKGELGNKVAVVDNGNGTYTLTVDGKEYVLPKASSSIFDFLAYTNAGERGVSYVTSYSKMLLGADTYDPVGNGVNWGVAGEDVADWTGPKGAVKKGQLLVGPMGTISVSVNPVDTDLTTAEFALVDMEGNKAPASFTPEKEESDITTGSRATAANGWWSLNVSLDATAENIATVYTDGENNKLYALSVDGKLMTDYLFAVDTWTAEESAANEDKPEVYISGISLGDKSFTEMDGSYDRTIALDAVPNVPLGKTQLNYIQDYIYDTKFEIAPESIEDAELLGVSIDSKTNTLIVSDKAAANTDKKIRINVTTMGVNGLVSDTKTFAISSFASTTVDDKQTIATTEYTMTTSTATNAKNIIINMEDVFTGLSAEQSTDLTTVAWSCDDLMASIAPTYYASLEDAQGMKNPININDNTAGSRVRTIKYAVIALSDYSSFKSTAKAGKYDLNVTLKTSKGEIKKVIAPVNISLPAFDSIFTKVDDNLWTAEGRSVRLTGDGTNSISLYGIFTNKDNIGADQLMIDNAKYTNASGNEADLISTSINTQGNINITGLIVDNAIVDNTLEVTMSYTFGSTAMKISTTFTANVKSQFDGAELVYYSAKNTTATTAAADANGLIAGGLGSAGAGLELQFNGDKKAVNAAMTAIDGITLGNKTTAEKPQTAGNVAYALTVEDCAVDMTATIAEKGIQLSNFSQLQKGQGGTLVVTFWDYDDVKTQVKIRFVK